MSGPKPPYRVGLLIASDRAASGEREDACEATLRQLLRDTRFDLVAVHLTSDDPETIADGIRHLLAQKLNLLLTSGGTGFGPRDNTPEAARPFIERPTPGIDEAIRSFSAGKSPHAIYSRAISGIAGRTLIINLPGSPKAVKEIVAFLLPTITHPLDLLRGDITDCAAGDTEP